MRVWGGDGEVCQNGSDATTAALKLARAYTGRDLVAICGDQPFFSTDDWFIGSTKMPAGIPEAIRELTVKFSYNDATTLEALLIAHPNRIACVFLEAETAIAPAGFLEMYEPCVSLRALLVLDETITGFRWDLGGHNACTAFCRIFRLSERRCYGFALAALAGKREVMERGG